MLIKLLMISIFSISLTACNENSTVSTDSPIAMKRPTCETLAIDVIKRSQVRDSIIGTLQEINTLHLITSNQTNIICKGSGLMQDGTHRFIQINAQISNGTWGFQSTQSSNPLP